MTQAWQWFKCWKSSLSVGEEPLPWASWGLPPSPPSSCCSGPWDLLEHQTAGVPFDHKGSMLPESPLNISKHQFCIFLTTGHSHRPFFLLIKVPESLLLANPVTITCFPGMRTGEPWGIEVKWGGGPEFKSQLCGQLLYFSKTWFISLQNRDNSQFFSNAGFENAVFLQHEWFIREQFEHNSNFKFAHVRDLSCLREALREHRKVCSAQAEECTKHT